MTIYSKHLVGMAPRPPLTTSMHAIGVAWITDYPYACYRRGLNLFSILLYFFQIPSYGQHDLTFTIISL